MTLKPQMTNAEGKRMEKKNKSFIITCGHEALHYMEKELWSCRGTTVTAFRDKRLAQNAIRTTIRRRQKMIEIGEVDEDNKFAKRQCYAFHFLETAKAEKKIKKMSKDRIMSLYTQAMQ